MSTTIERPPQSRSAAAAAPDPDGSYFEALVKDETGAESRVALPLGPDSPVRTQILQNEDNQGGVTLRLAYRNRALEPVFIPLPPRPRGEVVWVWLEVLPDGQLLVELEHDDTTVVCHLTLRGDDSNA